MELISLTKTVREAIQKKTGHIFDKVIIETEAPCSTGIFHLKVRHLDDFLDYFAISNKLEGDMLEGYANLRSLRPDQKRILKEYYKSFEDIKEHYTRMVDKYQGCIIRLRTFLGAKTRRQEKFKKLKDFSPEQSYKEDCDKMQDMEASFIQMEEDFPWVIKRLNSDILICIETIIKKPSKVYFNFEEGDEFTFCSKEDEYEYVLALKVRDEEERLASLRTGFQTELEELENNPNLDPIYEVT
jgi:hypothetical protein